MRVAGRFAEVGLVDQGVEGDVPIEVLPVRSGGNRIVPQTGIGKEGGAAERRSGKGRAGVDCRIEDDRAAGDDVARPGPCVEHDRNRPRIGDARAQTNPVIGGTNTKSP